MEHPDPVGIEDSGLVGTADPGLVGIEDSGLAGKNPSSVRTQASVDYSGPAWSALWCPCSAGAGPPASSLSTHCLQTDRPGVSAAFIPSAADGPRHLRIPNPILLFYLSRRPLYSGSTRISLPPPRLNLLRSLMIWNAGCSTSPPLLTKAALLGGSLRQLALPEKQQIERSEVIPCGQVSAARQVGSEKQVKPVSGTSERGALASYLWPR